MSKKKNNKKQEGMASIRDVHARRVQTEAVQPMPCVEVPDLTDIDEARRAFIAAEIFQRKY